MTNIFHYIIKQSSLYTESKSLIYFIITYFLDMKDKAVKNVVTMSLEMFVSCFLCHVTYSITLQQCNVAGNRLHITHYM